MKSRHCGFGSREKVGEIGKNAFLPRKTLLFSSQ
uniref:Uncharacterized protein n=1 Tax=Siphoviridae sp. ctPyh10 TaxID=2827865 RepID=A0A8S5SZL1_9CAUD|nr:MAG TPA: hypothetical protein [Siphoviridae sp. ctPyh10]